MPAEIGTEPRSRRAILAALGGGLAALVAQAIGRPLPARATDGSPVIQGQPNTGTLETTVTTVTTPALTGQSTSSIGLRGLSTQESSASARNTGVFGVAGAAANAAADTRQTGVYGFAEGNDSAGVGVHGDSAQAVGVLATGGDAGVVAEGFNAIWGFGALGFGVGVIGNADTGVFGYPGEDSGPGPALNTGVSGYAEWPANAAHFRGRTVFTRAGRLTVTEGRYYVERSGLPLHPSSLILAVVTSSSPGFWVVRVTTYPDLTTPTSSYFRVVLNATVPAGKSVAVAYFIVN